MGLYKIVSSFHPDKLRHMQEELDCERNRRESPRHVGLTAKSKGNSEALRSDILPFLWIA